MVADRTPDRLRFPDLAGRNTGIMPKSERWYEIRSVHRTVTQDLGVEMGRGLWMPALIQRRRRDGGCFPGRSKTEQILLFGDTAIHAGRQNLLGRTYARRSGPRRMVPDTCGSGRRPCPTSPHLHGRTSFLGEHVAVGQFITHRGPWLDKYCYLRR